MPFSKPVSAEINPFNGQLAGASRRYQKFFNDLKGVYLDEAAFDLLTASRGEEVAYEVYEYRANENPGDLIFGTSILFPGKVGDEYFMTRGHIHAKSDRPEVYYCQLGATDHVQGRFRKGDKPQIAQISLITESRGNRD